MKGSSRRRERFGYFGRVLWVSLVGALIAGLYGALHDQVTYSIGPEYYTHLKFEQFYYTARIEPVRLRVAAIGFLASWWVGFGIALLLAIRLSSCSEPRAFFRAVAVRVLIVLAFALAAGITGYAYGLMKGGDDPFRGWEHVQSELGVRDLAAFVRVAYIHNATYLGAFVGLVVVFVGTRRSSTGAS